ncbi:MAG: TetR/AcrR family transcriptional regulator [Pseudomonadota bacterium]
MPTPTFWNLDPDKRERLIEASMHEFALHEFAVAKIDHIAAASRVAKGSFYQYFDNKQDLYITTVDQALQQAWSFFKQQIEKRPPQTCFDLLYQAIVQMFDLVEQHPELAALYARVVHEPSSHLQHTLYPTYQAYSDEFHQRFYEQGLEGGDIHPALSKSVVRFQVHALGTRWNSIILTGDRPNWLPSGTIKLKPLIHESIACLRRAVMP